MADDLPTRESLMEGMTVEIVQEQENNAGEPLIGDIQTVITEENTHPQGIKVTLQSGATGRVKEIAPDEGDAELPQGGT
ncbi:MAG: DUF2196 domain-containing protein [Haloarculaceae archaeon]